jgi:hypothetical protein
MATDRSGVRDELVAVLDSRRGTDSMEHIIGHGVVEVFGEDGALKQSVPFTNLVTQYGDQFYGERAAGIGSHAVPTGMQLGTGGATAAAKTGAGAAIVTLVAASLVALDTAPASSLQGSSRRIQYKTTWAAGTATATGINEVVLTNQAVGTQTAAPAGATLSRAVLGTPVNKTATDSLAITWNHDLLGA